MSTPNSFLDTVYEAANTVLSSLMDTNNMYIATFDATTRLISFPLAYQNGLLVESVSKLPGTPWGPRHYNEKEGLLTDQIIKRGKPLLIANAFERRVQEELGIENLPIKAKSWLGAPLIFHDEIIGVIALQNFERENVFDKDDESLLITIANQTATAIVNSNLYSLNRKVAELNLQVAEDRQKRLSFFQQITDQIATAGMDSNTVLESIAKSTNLLLTGKITSIYLYDREIADFSSGIRAFHDDSTQVLTKADLEAKIVIARQVAETQTPLFIEDEVAPELSAWSKEQNIKSLAAIPLTIQDFTSVRMPVGVIFVNFDQARQFSESDKELLQQLAQQASVAIAYARYQVSVRDMGRMAALGAASANLQHRLGNTLYIILPAVQRLRRRLHGDTDVEEILDIIERNAKHAADVLKRLRIPKEITKFEPTDLNSSIRAALRQCLEDDRWSSQIEFIISTNEKPAIVIAHNENPKPQRIIIHTQLDGDLPLTHSSVAHLTETFRVLIENAVKAIYKKPASSEGQIKIKSQLVQNGIRPVIAVEISDTGTGIDEATRRRLIQEPITREEPGEGSGMGLWLSNYIVNIHQGTLRLEKTVVGEGSTFTVRLPVLHQPLPTAGSAT